MTAAEKEKRYTADEFYALEGLPERCELINGVIYDMSPSPSTEHQRLSKKLVIAIDGYIEKNKGNCEVFNAPLDVKLNDDTIVQPDVFVVCGKDKLTEQGCVGAPDWVIEILSPSNAANDLSAKLSLYRESGVREYWVADPMEKKVFVYIFGDPNTVGMYTFDDEIPVNIYRDNDPKLTVRIASLLE